VWQRACWICGACLARVAHALACPALGSPIKDFYPLDFKIDFEGKRNEWEGVVQVPFIDETRLLLASRSIDETRLTPAERLRNTPGSMYTFVYQARSLQHASHR
jgi:5'-3' exonuclease